MKKINYKKIFLLSLAFLMLPIFSYGQTFSNEISSVNWGNPVATSTSILVNGTMVHANNPPAPYRFQIEYGYPGTFTGQGSNVQIGGDAQPISFGPLLNSTEYLNSQNQFSISVINLYPSQYYYFDIYEWDMAATSGQPIQDFYLARTAEPDNITINFSTFQNGSSNLSGNITLPSNYTPGVIAGMPVGVYVLSAPSNTDVINPNDVLIALSMTVGATGSFSVPISNLSLNQQYYIRLVNELSGLPLMDSVPFMFNDQTNPPPIDTGGGNPGTGGTNPDFPDGGVEFENGLITCDGVDVPCTFEKLLLMVNKVLRFLIFVIGVPIVTLSFAYAGFLMVTSGGNPSKKDEAKSIIGNATIGLIVLLAAWLIVRTVLLVFGYTGPLLGILGA